MKRVLIAAVLLAGIVAPVAASAYGAGDWVLARYKGQQFFYTAKVVKIWRDVVTVRYESGVVENLYTTQVKDYDWDTGTRLQCKGADGAWYNESLIDTSGPEGVDLKVMYRNRQVWQKSRNCRSW